MNNKLLQFSEKLAEKKENKKISFHLSYEEYFNYRYFGPLQLITLDDEDINYFKNKYLPKLEDEYQTNLAELNKKYNK